LSLLDQALEYTQLEAAPVRPRTQRVELSMLIKDVCAALKTEMETRQITLVVDCQSPAVWADPQHTRSILTNLLRNAIQFSTPGSTVWLVGKASADAQEGVIEVRDQGSGIAAEDLPRLFQPFTRLASSVASVPGFSGHGLGLAIS
jgi:signal transduction histidine kinase